MPKTLNMVYNWIGPNGPITNTRIPNAVDIVESMFNIVVMRQGLGPLYHQIKEYVDANPVNPEWVWRKNQKFVYELEMLHTRVWDSNFKVGFGVLENTHIFDNMYHDIRQRKGYFLLTAPMESFLDDYMLNTIHHYFTVHDIPLSQIIYLTNSVNCKSVYDSFCERTNKSERINCEYIGTWINHLVPTCKDNSLQTPYIPGPRNKTFLKFNRRYREQRMLFLLEVHNRNILDEFYISFAKSEPESNETFVDYATRIRNVYSMNITDESIASLDKKLPLVLDTPDLSVFPVEKSLDETKRFYDDSLIHVIAETNFFGNIMHLTEKTLKPIMYKQPFIVVGPKDSLKYIRNLGFKTFSDIWDESYDTIDNDMDRMYRTIDLIENISKKSEQEKIEISHKVKDIVEYNFQQMRDRKPIELFDFVERYGV
jgi:hypothetical protein